jgi:hypothetical protein
MADQQSFKCATCGELHEGLPTDFGFRLPDEVHALGYLEQYQRTRSNSDLCTLDGSRHFIRGVLPLPIQETDDSFGWGVWAEVEAQCHDSYMLTWDEPGEGMAPFTGKLANDLPGYEGTLGLAVEVQFGPAGQRPTLRVAQGVMHALALEQRSGISRKRHHDIIEATGFFNE